MDILKQFTKITPAQIKNDIQFLALIGASVGFKFDGAISDNVTYALVGATAFIRAVQAIVGAVKHKAAAQVIAAAPAPKK